MIAWLLTQFLNFIIVLVGGLVTFFFLWAGWKVATCDKNVYNEVRQKAKKGKLTDEDLDRIYG
jgi:hypothetical protein